MTEIQEQEVDRSQGTWKWWKRRGGSWVAGDGHSSSDEHAISFREFFNAEHYGVDSSVDGVEREATRSVPMYPEAGSVYFKNFFDDQTEQEEPDMSSLNDAVKLLLAVEGATGAAIVDYTSGMALAQGGSPGFDLGVAAAGNSNVVSSKLRTMAELGLESDIDDILITLGSQYHLINVLNSDDSRGLFVYLVLDRAYANLALARHKLNNLAKTITI